MSLIRVLPIVKVSSKSCNTAVQNGLMSKRFLQTINLSVRSSSSATTTNEMLHNSNNNNSMNYSIGNNRHHQSSQMGDEVGSKWSKHELPRGKSLKELLEYNDNHTENSRRYRKEPVDKVSASTANTNTNTNTNSTSTTNNTKTSTSSASTKPHKKRRQLRPRKALITLSPNAVRHLKALSAQPTPKMIRIGVMNRGCSGLTYHLEYVTEPGKFDESVEQDGVKVLIDSKALFSIVGSEMDWIDNKLASKFVFKNPNSKGTCGCGESFMV
ncbi:hypothetical protein PACTADRAFT_51493 [Pachysolen tannophilus NRRL Y-2460]|uniref:Iron-sulfur assembly protein 1 n=1 Tax=Pachysolen tannophilus NRRL Y-2460 TaxID=669874 RepID=A0A1E4TPP4_PACTA|nr:hypothetical protein PACTADRAFT_51493 [Pachysolen tannophilus NRRL Y-2460]